MKGNRYVFLSDAHLGTTIPGAQLRDRFLNAFLHSLVGKVDRIFFLGDMFDFWIEYDQWIRPEFHSFVETLKDLASSGIILDYIPGNHDFSLGPFLFQETGMLLHPHCVEMSLANKRLFLAHGDRLSSQGPATRFIRSALWNASCHKCYKFIPRQAGIKIALFFSAVSRLLHQTGLIHNSRERLRKIGIDLMNSGYDMVILGHSHFPEIITRGGRQYCNTGQWIYRHTYVTFDKSGLVLREYAP